MPAKTYDIDIEQGATWRRTFRLRSENGQAFDLSGCTARMQIRPAASSKKIMLDLRSGQGIEVEGTTGSIMLHITAEQTSSLSSDGVYDIEITQGNEVARVLQGNVVVSPEVTR